MEWLLPQIHKIDWAANKSVKKKIAIKATSFLGTSPNGAEPFTIDFFCEYLKEFGYEVEIINLHHEVSKACVETNDKNKFEF